MIDVGFVFISRFSFRDYLISSGEVTGGFRVGFGSNNVCRKMFFRGTIGYG